MYTYMCVCIYVFVCALVHDCMHMLNVSVHVFGITTHVLSVRFALDQMIPVFEFPGSSLESAGSTLCLVNG